jgi:hypothetical protein
MANRNYSVKQLKALISLTGNECEYTNCDFKLVVNDHFIGQIAHIAALNPGGARYDENMTPEQRNTNDNLIVLCPSHHALIDTDIDSHPVELLLEMKTKHEKKISGEHKELVVDDTLITIINAEIVAEQNNVNSGSGTQINSQQIIYNTPQELAEHIKLARRNVKRYSERIRVALRRDDVTFGQLQALLVEIVIAGAYTGLEDDDFELYKLSINELRKISTFCYVDHSSQLKSNADHTYIQILEFILYSCYEIGAYCVDNQLFPQLKYLVEVSSMIPQIRTDRWVYCIGHSVVRERRYMGSEIFAKVLDYVKRGLAYRLGWSSEETTKYLSQFEYLANIYIRYDFGKERDFPVHADYYEDYEIRQLLEMIVSDPALLSDAFPNTDKTKLADSIRGFERYLGSFQGIGLGGYYTSDKLTDFIKQNATEE